MKTVDGRKVQVTETGKAGMSIFTTVGLLDGRPCHWTADGQFRMDSKEDGRDISGFTEPGDAL